MNLFISIGFGSVLVIFSRSVIIPGESSELRVKSLSTSVKLVQVLFLFCLLYIRVYLTPTRIYFSFGILKSTKTGLAFSAYILAANIFHSINFLCSYSVSLGL